MNGKLKYIIILVVLMILVIGVGTFAWLSYRTNDTAMVLTIGEIDNVRVSLSPYQINGNISPVTTYTSGIVTNVEAINNSSSSQHVRLYYLINTIDLALATTSFKYTITKSTNGSTFSSYLSGNFSGKSNDSILDIMDDIVPGNGTTYLYKVYIWLDGNGGNQNNVSGKKFDGELRAEINSSETFNKISNTQVSTLKTIANSKNDGIYYFDSNGNLDYGDGSTPISVNLGDDKPKGIVSIWNDTLIYSCLNYGDLNYEYDYKTNKVSSRSMPCPTERYNNLVVNGDLSYNTNYNLTTFGSYLDGYLTKTLSANSTVSTTDYIAVDPNKKYILDVDLKSSDTAATYYFGFYEYDEYKQAIGPNNVMYINNTLTTLTQDLTSVDTVVHLANIANWSNNTSSRTYQRGFIFWNYVDNTGYSYPASTYSRNAYSSLYADSGVDKTNNTITLSSKWGRDTVPAGTLVSQSNSGSTFNYSVLSNRKLTTNWATYSSGNITGICTNYSVCSNKFRAGTKFIKVTAMYDYNKTANTTTDTMNINFREVQ